MAVAEPLELTTERGEQDALWRALANPVRRELLDQLRSGPRTTGELADSVPALSRFAVMQHLEVLASSGLVLVRRQGRQRFNYLNAAPLRRWYERWVVPLADQAAAEMLGIERVVNGAITGGSKVSVATAPTNIEQIRTIRLENELRFHATPDRVWEAITERSLEWFPHTYGQEKVKRLVWQQRVGGLHYEDWGQGAGHVYGSVVECERPRLMVVRGRLDMGSILDTQYEIEQDGDESVLRVSKVAVGPFTEEEAAGIHRYGNLSNFEDALRRVIES